MDKHPNKKLRNAVKRFRKAIEKIAPSSGHIGIEAFPVGACAPSAEMLGEYLKSLGLGEFQFVSGLDGNQSHAWIEQNGWIIDISGAQFKEIKQEVLITKDYSYHNRFKNQERKPLKALEELDRGAHYPLMPVYKKISLEADKGPLYRLVEYLRNHHL